MTEQFRRIITGLNDKGKSIIVIDGPPGNQFESEAGALLSLWQTTHDVIDPHDFRDKARDPLVLDPPGGGSRIMIFILPPMPPDAPREMIETLTAQTFARIGAAGARIDTARHPAMHRTDTIDYVIVLSGEVTLLLEEEEVRLKPFDVVVQRGTNHAWIAHGDKPAVIAAVLIDASIERAS
jgi:mannose-6-phosphate isomerase-like protein (cupin superfamily)